MTAHEIVEALIGEAKFIGNGGYPQGYYGIVDKARDVVRAEYSDNLGQEDHSWLGRNPAWHRFRYAINRTVPLVHWTTDPSDEPEVKEMVEEWLAKKGYKVAGHTLDYGLWR